MQSYDLRHDDLVDGQVFSFEGGIGQVPLRLLAGSPDGNKFQAVFDIDAEKIAKSRIERDLVVAQIMGEVLSEDDARAKRSGDRVSGSLTVTLTTDSEGNVWRRETKSTIETVSNGERVTTERQEAVLERTPFEWASPTPPPATG